MRKTLSLVFIIAALVVGIVGGVHTTAAQDGTDVRVLTWESTPTDDGDLKFIVSGGNEEVLVDLPAGANGVWAKRCGQEYWSADGQGAAVFAGAQQGTLAIYPLAGGEPTTLGQVHRMACAGPATFQFSPNRSRIGLINYDDASLRGEYAHGNLQFYDSGTGAQIASFEWANAFALYDDGALMLRIFPDGEGYGAEADLEWWDGSSRRTLTTLEPVRPEDREGVDCGFRTASVARLGDTAYALVGQRCEQTAVNEWRLLSVPMAGGPATEIASGQPVGGFFIDSFTVNLFPAADGSGFLMTMPSGLSPNTVAMQWITPGGAITPILEGRHIVAERFGERLSEGRLLMTAPDGSAMSFVSVTGNNDQSLWMLDMSTQGGSPVLLEEEGTGQRIFQHVWSATNNLYFIAGSIQSNSLYMAMPGGTPQRLERGRFFRVAVSYDGNKIAVAEWYENPNSVGDDLFQLKIFDTSGNAFVLKKGGEEHNQMIPLAVQ